MGSPRPILACSGGVGVRFQKNQLNYIGIKPQSMEKESNPNSIKLYLGFTLLYIKNVKIVWAEKMQSNKMYAQTKYFIVCLVKVCHNTDLMCNH